MGSMPKALATLIVHSTGQSCLSVGRTSVRQVRPAKTADAFVGLKLDLHLLEDLGVSKILNSFLDCLVNNGAT